MSYATDLAVHDQIEKPSRESHPRYDPKLNFVRGKRNSSDEKETKNKSLEKFRGKIIRNERIKMK